jgi:preprotein translocase subunit SecB
VSDGVASDARELVRSLLTTVRLRHLVFLSVDAERLEHEPVDPEVSFPVGINMGYQIHEQLIACRFEVSIQRPDLNASVAIAVHFEVDDEKPFMDTGAAKVFVENVALPVAYPYARSKLSEITQDMGTPGVTLALIYNGETSVKDQPADGGEPPGP